MKHKLTKTFSYIRSFRHILLVLSLFSVQALFNGLSAQVVVGNTTEPVEAAVLQLKTQDAASSPTSVGHDDNVTSAIGGGGLGLPRVKLVHKEKLLPFIAAPSATEKLKHAGLMVYNIYKSLSSVTEPNEKFKLGVYVWDGAKWSLVGDGTGQRFFYMPAFNLPLNRETDLSNPNDMETVNLYDVYAWQFSKNRSGSHPYMSSTLTPLYVANPLNTTSDKTVPSPENDHLYKATDLDYVVIHYDTEIIYVDRIEPDGRMYYHIKKNDPGPESFINIVFVVKE